MRPLDDDESEDTLPRVDLRIPGPWESLDEFRDALARADKDYDLTEDDLRSAFPLPPSAKGSPPTRDRALERSVRERVRSSITERRGGSSRCPELEYAAHHRVWQRARDSFIPARARDPGGAASSRRRAKPHAIVTTLT